LLTGAIVLAVAAFFTPLSFYSIIAIIGFAFLTALVFSLAGLLNGLWANSFDEVGTFSTFVLVPLTYLGGVFYPTSGLPGFWKTVSMFNPIVYMIEGFRYGFFGTESQVVSIGFWMLSALSVVLCLLTYKIFMDTDQDLKKHWKVNRDVKERGYSLDQVLEKIKKREGDYLRYIYPQRNNADLIVQFNESGLKLQFNDKFDLSSITGKLHEKSVNYSISFSPITMNFPSAFNYDIITLFIMDWYDKFTRNQ
jgi:hypothetical protein